jgi:plasmid stability protein
MANLTITIDEEVLKKARMRALEEGTSVNAILREYLESYTGLHRGHEATIAKIVDLSKRSRSRKGSARWTRDDLHDRSL